jgi:hypothetical protein
MALSFGPFCSPLGEVCAWPAPTNIQKCQDKTCLDLLLLLLGRPCFFLLCSNRADHMEFFSSRNVSLGVGSVGEGHWPELTTPDEAGEPLRRVPLVPRSRRRVEVHAVDAKPEAIAEEVLEHIKERPHEVALYV